MSQPLEVEVVVMPDGSITTKVLGGHGRSCRDATKALRDALGQTTEDRALPEFYEESTQANTVRSRS
jgi:hypothetical protein